MVTYGTAQNDFKSNAGNLMVTISAPTPAIFFYVGATTIKGERAAEMKNIIKL